MDSSRCSVRWPRPTLPYPVLHSPVLSYTPLPCLDLLYPALCCPALSFSTICCTSWLPWRSLQTDAPAIFTPSLSSPLMPCAARQPHIISCDLISWMINKIWCYHFILSHSNTSAPYTVPSLLLYQLNNSFPPLLLFFLSIDFSFSFYLLSFYLLLCTLFLLPIASTVMLLTAAVST